MKLKVFDRILLAILLIAAIVVSFVLFGVAANVVKEAVAVRFIGLFYAFRENALILAGCGLVLLLISLKLLFAGRGAQREQSVRPASTLMKQTEIGGAYISLDAIDAMVQRHCRTIQRVKDVHTTIRADEAGVTIGIRLSVLADTDVITLSNELQSSLKAYVESLTGIEVKEIGVLIENASASSTSAPSRVE